MFGDLLGKSKMRGIVDVLLSTNNATELSNKITSLFDQSIKFHDL